MRPLALVLAIPLPSSDTKMRTSGRKASKKASKASRKLFLLRSLQKFGFNNAELNITYCGYIRPVLEYADVVWHPGLTTKLRDCIENVQRRACRIMLSKNFTTYSAALNLFGLDSLSNRRVEHCRKFAKGLSKLKKTADLIPPTRLRCHGRNLRSKNKIAQLPIKTARFAIVQFHILFNY